MKKPVQRTGYIASVFLFGYKYMKSDVAALRRSQISIYTAPFLP